MIVYFHRISPSSFILNLVVGLLLTALAGVALLALALSQVSLFVAVPFFKLANAINWLMVHSVDPFASAGIASVRVPEYSGLTASIYVLYYLPLILIFVSAAKWQPLGNPSFVRPKLQVQTQIAVMLQLLLVMVVLVHPKSAGTLDGKLRIDFLDVGQGDAALVTMPNGVTLLVDGGGRPGFLNSSDAGGRETSFERDTRSVGEAVVSEYLWWRGLGKVDYVLATHADADHMDGLNDVVRNFAVGCAFVARIPGDDMEFAKFAESLANTHTPLQVLHAGDKLQFGSVEARVLWPPTNVLGASRNNDSVVLRLQFADRSVLLTGDIEKEAEGALVGNGEDLRVDVVKVAHHGSRTSSTDSFVATTKPKLAIISVGQTSMFGHPHPEVVERWRASGAEVMTTGKCGTISLSTDGKTWEVTKFVKECE
jgi:competence protein ComEC